MATQKSAARGVLGAGTKNIPVPTNANATVAVEGNDEEQATPYTHALARLEPLLPVLAGLAHRNRNQHRHAAWWRYFGMLRRNCAKLVERLIAAGAAARKAAAKAAKVAKAKGKKRRREELVSGETSKDVVDDAQTVEFEVDAGVVAHVDWLRDVLVPKCYLAFSQLTADNQFATLGVVLLGVLAQVQAACECVVPAPPVSSPESPRSDVRTATGGQDPAVPAVQKQDSGVQPANEEMKDVPGEIAGRTISREDVERASKKRQKEKLKEAEKGDAKKVIATERPAPPHDKSQASSSRDMSIQPEEPPAKKIKTTTSVSKEKPKVALDKDKKKKKKAKKGDEFDDLFKGLF